MFFRRFLAFLLVVLAFSVMGGSGCATTRLLSRDVRVPSRDKVYVSTFVDQTREGRMGIPVADALRREIYRRAPQRLSMAFDDESVCVDGTVLGLRDVNAGDRRNVILTVRATLVDKDGHAVSDLGVSQFATQYRVARSHADTEAARDDALRKLLLSVASDLAARIDAAGGRQQAGVIAAANR